MNKQVITEKHKLHKCLIIGYVLQWQNTRKEMNTFSIHYMQDLICPDFKWPN